MYAIVRSGGQQQKVAVGDVIQIDKVDDRAGRQPVAARRTRRRRRQVTTDADKLAKVDVQAEVIGATKGPKIHILKYKNKTGYRKRQGHRQHYTQVKVTAINTK